MSTLFGFGDSYTQGHKLDTTYPRYKEWKEYLGKELPDTWIDILSQKLNLEIRNYAIAGMGNQEIFQSICNHSDEFKKGDLVIINWTFMQRFRWVGIERNDLGVPMLRDGKVVEYWVRLSSNPQKGFHIDENTRNDIAVNRTNKLYREEIYDYEKIIDTLAKAIGFDVYYWSADSDLIFEKNLTGEYPLKKYILSDIVAPPDHSNGYIDFHIIKFFGELGGLRICDETDFDVNDIHLGESGHKLQAELFYNYINKFN
jgi:hypothetical protein